MRITRVYKYKNTTENFLIHQLFFFLIIKPLKLTQKNVYRNKRVKILLFFFFFFARFTLNVYRWLDPILFSIQSLPLQSVKFILGSIKDSTTFSTKYFLTLKAVNNCLPITICTESTSYIVP